jgi:hypothetical protein
VNLLKERPIPLPNHRHHLPQSRCCLERP